MKKLTTICLTVLMVAMLLCSCDPAAVKGNEKSVDKIVLDLRSSVRDASSTAPDGTAGPIEIDDWDENSFSWYYRLTVPEDATNKDTEPSGQWNPVTMSSGSFSILGPFTYGDKYNVQVIGVAEDDESADELVANAIYGTSDTFEIGKNITDAEDSSISINLNVGNALKTGTGTISLVLEYDYNDDDNVDRVSDVGTWTIKIGDVTGTWAEDLTDDGNGNLTGTCNFTIDYSSEGTDLEITIIADDETIVDGCNLATKAYVYKGFTTVVYVSMTGHDTLTLNEIKVETTFPADPNGPGA